MMPTGKRWTVTANRKAIIINMLKKQHSIKTLATSFGINEKTMSKALKKAGINPNDYKQLGIYELRHRMLERLEMIDDHKDYANVAVKVLDRYDPDVNKINTSNALGSKNEVTIKSDKDIKMQILQELSE